MHPRIILAFDTSAAHCAAALLWSLEDEGYADVFREEWRVEPMAKGQAERLVPMIEAFMLSHAVGWRDLDGVVVGVGPGNFTGVRIAVSFARGLSLGLGVPAAGVEAFREFDGVPRPHWVVVDAPRDQFHARRIDVVDGPARTIGAADLDALDAPVCRVGDRTPEARIRAIAEAGRSRLARGVPPRPAPFYMRAADATPSSDPPPRILPDPVP